MRQQAVRVAVAGALVIALSACGATSATTPESSTSPSTLPTTTMSAPAGSPSPSPSVSASAPASAVAQPAGKATPILGGVLIASANERVLADVVNSQEARDVVGSYAATRATRNPLPAYRKQLVAEGWTFDLDKPRRIAAHRRGAWITITLADLRELTSVLPWSAVISYAEATRTRAGES